jgi:hypothetical protein
MPRSRGALRTAPETVRYRRFFCAATTSRESCRPTRVGPILTRNNGLASRGMDPGGWIQGDGQHRAAGRRETAPCPPRRDWEVIPGTGTRATRRHPPDARSAKAHNGLGRPCRDDWPNPASGPRDAPRARSQAVTQPPHRFGKPPTGRLRRWHGRSDGPVFCRDCTQSLRFNRSIRRVTRREAIGSSPETRPRAVETNARGDTRRGAVPTGALFPSANRRTSRRGGM